MLGRGTFALEYFMAETTRETFLIPENLAGQRADVGLASLLEVTRSNMQKLLDEGRVSRGEKMRNELDELPYTVDGMRNCTWVAMDYSDTVVHIFVPESRQFYDIDNLWEDAPYSDIPDLD